MMSWQLLAYRWGLNPSKQLTFLVVFFRIIIKIEEIFILCQRYLMERFSSKVLLKLWDTDSNNWFVDFIVRLIIRSMFSKMSKNIYLFP